MSPMMLAVALAVLGGPAVATFVADAAGWTASALAIGSALPLALAGAGARIGGGGEHGARTRVSIARRYNDPRGVRAGWIVSACVLAGHWTVLTRIAEALGSGGLGAGDRWIATAPLIGALGLPLVVLAARACDRVGPRAPMVATLAVGCARLRAGGQCRNCGRVPRRGGRRARHLLGVPAGRRGAGAAQRRGRRTRACGGRAVRVDVVRGGAGGRAGVACPSWRAVLAGAALSWATGAIIALRRFIRAPAIAHAELAATRAA